MRTERPTCRECECTKVCEYFQNENERNLDEVCPLCNWENYFVPKQEWISVEERLPEDGENVLIWVGKVESARFEKGISEEEREKMKNGELEDPIEYGWSKSDGLKAYKRSQVYRDCDVFGNNLVPYHWTATSGPMDWFGQDVHHWMPLPEPPRKEDENGKELS